MKYSLIAILLIYVMNIFAQKQDYIWIDGYDYDLNTIGIEGFTLDFNKTLRISPRTSFPFGFKRNIAIIASNEGEQLIYSNGCAIMNRYHQMMPNGDSINAGEWYDKFWFSDCSRGYPGAQDLIILEDPKDEYGYYLLHKPIILQQTKDSMTLSYSYIDLSLEGGLGDVTVKNKSYYPYRDIMFGYHTAIRHKNGRDWWIIQPTVEDSTFLTFLIDENGINRKQDQNTHQYFNWYRSSASGMAKFSPDGRKYALYNYYDQLHIYDFDRSTGLLTNHQKINIYHPDSIDISEIIFGSVEWSSDSRYLYTSSEIYIHQLDMWASDIPSSSTIVATYDGSKDPFSSKFNFMALGPDCRLYITPGNTSFSYSIINKPNEKGNACGFVQNGIKLPWPASGSFPNFPRFRVDEVDKCDPTISSIFGDDVYYRRDLEVYPNPSTGLFNIKIPPNIYKSTIIVTDINGQIILQKSTNQSIIEEIDITHLPSGSYNIEVYPDINKERIFYGRQVVKI